VRMAICRRRSRWPMDVAGGATALIADISSKLETLMRRLAIDREVIGQSFVRLVRGIHLVPAVMAIAPLCREDAHE
jgi:hypothetical protein